MEIAFLIGRVVFGGYFLVNAYGHLAHSGGMAGYAASKKVPSPKTAVIVSGLLLLVGGLSIITGFMPRLGLLAVLLFLVPVTFMVHNYWKATDPHEKMAERIQFQKNLALIGAVLMMYALSLPWAYSL